MSSNVPSVSQAVPSNPSGFSLAQQLFQLPQASSSSSTPDSGSPTPSPSPSFSPCSSGTDYPFYASTPIVSTEVPAIPGVAPLTENYQTIVMMPEYRHKSTEVRFVPDATERILTRPVSRNFVWRTILLDAMASPTAVAANFEVAFKPFAWTSTPGHPAAFSARSTVDAVPAFPGRGHGSVSPAKTTKPSNVTTVEATSILPPPSATASDICAPRDAKGTSSSGESSFYRGETLTGDGAFAFSRSGGGKIHPFLSTSNETFDAPPTSSSESQSLAGLSQSQHPSSTSTSLLDDYSSHKLCNRRLDAEVDVRTAEEILRRATQARCARLEEDLKGMSRALDVKSARIQALEEQLTEAQLARCAADESHAKSEQERDDLRDGLEGISESIPVARVDASEDAAL